MGTGDVLSEVLVRQKEHAVGAERLHDLDGIGRRAADVGLCP